MSGLNTTKILRLATALIFFATSLPIPLSQASTPLDNQNSNSSQGLSAEELNEREQNMMNMLNIFYVDYGYQSDSDTNTYENESDMNTYTTDPTYGTDTTYYDSYTGTYTTDPTYGTDTTYYDSYTGTYTTDPTYGTDTTYYDSYTGTYTTDPTYGTDTTYYDSYTGTYTTDPTYGTDTTYYDSYTGTYTTDPTYGTDTTYYDSYTGTYTTDPTYGTDTTYYDSYTGTYTTDPTYGTDTTYYDSYTGTYTTDPTYGTDTTYYDSYTGTYTTDPTYGTDTTYYDSYTGTYTTDPTYGTDTTYYDSYTGTYTTDPTYGTDTTYYDSYTGTYTTDPTYGTDTTYYDSYTGTYTTDPTYGTDTTYYDSYTGTYTTDPTYGTDTTYYDSYTGTYTTDPTYGTDTTYYDSYTGTYTTDPTYGTDTSTYDYGTDISVDTSTDVDMDFTNSIEDGVLVVIALDGGLVHVLEALENMGIEDGNIPEDQLINILNQMVLPNNPNVIIPSQVLDIGDDVFIVWVNHLVKEELNFDELIQIFQDREFLLDEGFDPDRIDIAHAFDVSKEIALDLGDLSTARLDPFNPDIPIDFVPEHIPHMMRAGPVLNDHEPNGLMNEHDEEAWEWSLGLEVPDADITRGTWRFTDIEGNLDFGFTITNGVPSDSNVTVLDNHRVLVNLGALDPDSYYWGSAIALDQHGESYQSNRYEIEPREEETVEPEVWEPGAVLMGELYFTDSYGEHVLLLDGGISPYEYDGEHLPEIYVELFSADGELIGRSNDGTRNADFDEDTRSITDMHWNGGISVSFDTSTGGIHVNYGAVETPGTYTTSITATWVDPNSESDDGSLATITREHSSTIRIGDYPFTSTDTVLIQNPFNGLSEIRGTLYLPDEGDWDNLRFEIIVDGGESVFISLDDERISFDEDTGEFTIRLDWLEPGTHEVELNVVMEFAVNGNAAQNVHNRIFHDHFTIEIAPFATLGNGDDSLAQIISTAPAVVADGAATISGDVTIIDWWGNNDPLIGNTSSGVENFVSFTNQDGQLVFEFDIRDDIGFDFASTIFQFRRASVDIAGSDLRDDPHQLLADIPSVGDPAGNGEEWINIPLEGLIDSNGHATIVLPPDVDPNELILARLLDQPTLTVIASMVHNPPRPISLPTARNQFDNLMRDMASQPIPEFDIMVDHESGSVRIVGQLISPLTGQPFALDGHQPINPDDRWGEAWVRHRPVSSDNESWLGNDFNVFEDFLGQMEDFQHDPNPDAWANNDDPELWTLQSVEATFIDDFTFDITISGLAPGQHEIQIAFTSAVMRNFQTASFDGGGSFFVEIAPEDNNP